jgi:outer membrane protein assembly factor BamB
VRKTAKGDHWIILAGQDRSVYALSSTGKCQWSSIHQDFDAAVISTPVLGDFLGRKSADVVLAAADGKIYLLNGDRGWLVWKSQETSGRFFSTPLLAKINQDSIPDVVVGSPNKILYALDGKTGLKLWERPLDGPVNSSAVALDGESFVVCDESGFLHHIKSETGRELQKINLGSPVIASPALLNRDVAPVLVVPLKDGSVKALSVSDFKVLWEYDTKYQDPIVASPARFDLNADGCEDVVITSRNGYLYLLDGKNGKDLVAPYFVGNSVSSSPVLGDINGDGFLDIVFGSENGNVIAVTVKTVPDRLIRRNSIVYGSFLNRGNEKI